jgi:hypothetical protein
MIATFACSTAQKKKESNCNSLELPQHDLPQNQDRVGKIIPRFSFFTLGLGRAA